MATTRRGASVRDPDVEGVKVLSEAEGRALFDEVARHVLGISGEEFLRRWDAGEYEGAAGHRTTQDEHLKLMRVAQLIPFGR